MTATQQAASVEVFPALGVFISIGVAGGALGPLLLNALTGLGTSQRLTHSLLSSGFGAILGLFIGLSRGV